MAQNRVDRMTTLECTVTEAAVEASAMAAAKGVWAHMVPRSISLRGLRQRGIMICCMKFYLGDLGHGISPLQLFFVL